jgi:cellulose synthase operon protein YhjQ
MTLICFASPKGGVGKTTLAANVANELARAGQRVIALDLDPQNSLRLHFGFPLQEMAGFTHGLAVQPNWRGCLRQTPSGVSLLPYGQSTAEEAIALALAVAEAPTLLRQPVDDILAAQDFCLVVDTPPGASPLLAALLPRVDLLVTVLLADATSTSLIPAVERGIADAARSSVHAGPDMGFVLNQFDPRTRLGGVIADAAARRLGDSLLGIVYRDEYVAEAAAAQKLLAEYAAPSKANHDIAAIGRAILHRLRLPVNAPADAGTGRHP